MRWMTAFERLRRPGTEGPLVDVWRLRFDDSVRATEADWRILNNEELARARAFRFESDRQRFCCSRIFLRVVLADYLDSMPARLELLVNPQGKPYLTGSGLRFNLSHCAGVALLAVAWEVDVGIDIEMRDAITPREAMRSPWLGEFDDMFKNVLNRPAQAQAGEAFLRHWTRAEAVLKAAGSGWSLPTSATTGIDAPGKDRHAWWMPWRRRQDYQAYGQYHLFDLSDAQTVATLAVDTRLGPPRWRWMT